MSIQKNPCRTEPVSFRQTWKESRRACTSSPGQVRACVHRADRTRDQCHGHWWGLDDLAIFFWAWQTLSIPKGKYGVFGTAIVVKQGGGFTRRLRSTWTFSASKRCSHEPRPLRTARSICECMKSPMLFCGCCSSVTLGIWNVKRFLLERVTPVVVNVSPLSVSVKTDRTGFEYHLSLRCDIHWTRVPGYALTQTTGRSVSSSTLCCSTTGLLAAIPTVFCAQLSTLRVNFADSSCCSRSSRLRGTSGAVRTRC